MNRVWRLALVAGQQHTHRQSRIDALLTLPLIRSFPNKRNASRNCREHAAQQRIPSTRSRSHAHLRSRTIAPTLSCNCVSSAAAHAYDHLEQGTTLSDEALALLDQHLGRFWIECAVHKLSRFLFIQRHHIQPLEQSRTPCGANLSCNERGGTKASCVTRQLQ